MKAAVFERFGDPAEVVQCRDVPVPDPGPGQVRVRMIASPINPSDLMVVRGEYGRLPRLPATPGFEGVGIVEAAGSGWIGRFRVGKRVAVLNGTGGNWQEQVIVPALSVVPLPDGIPDEQAASFFVNPATTLVMVRSVLQVPRGAWLIQTAAASALGKMVIRLGKHLGFRTLNVVRRRESADEVTQLGGDAVICTADESIVDRAQTLTHGELHYALDAVGGQTAVEVVKSLGHGGRMLVYGTLSGEPMPLDPRTLMVGSIGIEGFWLSNWVARQNKLTMLRLFQRIKALLAAGVLTTEVGKVFSLADIQSAVSHALTAGRRGKTLLRFDTASQENLTSDTKRA